MTEISRGENEMIDSTCLNCTQCTNTNDGLWCEYYSQYVSSSDDAMKCNEFEEEVQLYKEREREVSK